MKRREIDHEAQRAIRALRWEQRRRAELEYLRTEHEDYVDWQEQNRIDNVRKQLEESL